MSRLFRGATEWALIVAGVICFVLLIQPSAPAAAMSFNPSAPLNTSTVRDLRPMAGSCSELPREAPPAGGPVATPAPTPQPPQTGGKVNVNTATLAQLDALPGIGTVLAARIVENRPYSSVNDLHRVARLPFSKVAPLVTV